MDINPADLVCSTAGRDKEKYFMVLSVIDSQYVLLCDGKMRPVDKPKKKKIKHVKLLDYSLDRIKEKFAESKKINNADVRKAIKSAMDDLGISS